MTRLADAKKAANTLALFGLAGCAAAAAVWYFDAPARAPRAAVPLAAATALAAPPARTTPPAPGSAAPPMPVSLAGSAPPRLPLDGRARLRKARGVRDFFDYFLAAQNELSAGALDALVRKQIAAQLDGTAAQLEALDVWRRYEAYRQAIDRLAPLSAPEATSEANRTSASATELDAMQSALDERASLASRTLGVDWNEAFFGPDWRRGRHAIERLRIERDGTLTAVQKAARLQALDETLPRQERDALDRDRQARAAVDTVAQLQRQDLSPDQLKAKATQELGPQAAERIVTMQRDDDAWRVKYADYAAQRARIDAMGLAPADRQAQVAQLRGRMFAKPGEALRAASLDRAAGD